MGAAGSAMAHARLPLARAFVPGLHTVACSAHRPAPVARAVRRMDVAVSVAPVRATRTKRVRKSARPTPAEPTAARHRVQERLAGIMMDADSLATSRRAELQVDALCRELPAHNVTLAARLSGRPRPSGRGLPTFQGATRSGTCSGIGTRSIVSADNASRTWFATTFECCARTDSISCTCISGTTPGSARIAALLRPVETHVCPTTISSPP